MNVAMNILPPGFSNLVAQLAAKKAAATPKKPGRKSLIAPIAKLVKLGKAPTLLQFDSEVNYTYNRHADRLYRLWEAGDLAGLESYSMNGVNTYARACRQYRDLLIDSLKGGK